ncbi:MAG: LppX_LprAFG lipoprotein [Ktedonobacteraceae bacterium]
MFRIFSNRLSARHILGAFLLCIASALLFAGCALPWQHSANAQASLGPKPTTHQLLATIQKNFRTVSTFHVVMQVDNAGTPPSGSIQIRNANGDVIMPDKVSAQANIVLSGQVVGVKLISVGNNQYVTDPITGQWRVIKGVLDPRTLTNPNTGLISLVGKVQNVSQPTDDNVNGTPCWRISGQLDAKYLKFLTGGGVPAGTMLQTSACIGKADGLPYEVKVTGMAAVGDTNNTTYSFELSNYNENVSITAPQI